MKTLIKTLAVAAGIALALKNRVIVIKRKDEPEPTVFKPYKPQDRPEDLPRWSELTEEERARFRHALDKAIAGSADIDAPLRVLRNIQNERKNQNG
nr:MAG TPA: Protein of unknown function (DUF1722) [Caudoviricetes sp.]